MLLITSPPPSAVTPSSLSLVPVSVPPPSRAAVVVPIAVVEAVVKVVSGPHHPAPLEVAVPRPPPAEGPELTRFGVYARLLALVGRARGEAPPVADVVAVKVGVDVRALGQEAVGAAWRANGDEAGGGNAAGNAANLRRQARLD